MAWGDGATFDPTRTGWNLLFATGDVEMLWVWDPETREWEEQPVEMTEAWLRKLDENFKAQRKHMARLGASPQPYPISIQHQVEERVFWGCSPWEGAEGLRWMGAIHQTSYHPGGAVQIGEVELDLPAGLYSLNEWTSEALEAIADGKWSQLSPTTVRDMKMTDDTMFEGDNLFAIGLVDYGKLDSIGTLRDCLPWDAFDLVDAKPRAVEGEMNSLFQLRALRAAMGETQQPDTTEAPELHPVMPDLRAHGELVLRRHSRSRPFARPPESTEPRSNDASTAATPPSSNAPAMIEPNTVTEPTEPAATQADPAPRAAEPAAEPAPVTATATEPRSAEPPREDDPVAAIQRMEREQNIAECRKLVTERRLLARDVSAVLERMSAGQSYDDLLGDYGVPTARAGHSTGEPTDGNAAPASDDIDTRANSGTFDESELVAWARSKAAVDGAEPWEVFRKREAEILAAKGTINRAGESAA